MKNLAIIITLLIIWFTLSLDEETYILDITLSEEFVVPNDEFPNSKYNLFFRLPFPSINENLALITRYSVNDGNFSGQACDYKTYPTD